MSIKYARTTLCALVAASMLLADTGAAGFPVTIDVPAQTWNRQVASSLLAYIERIDAHGLEPADYSPEMLRQAIRFGDAEELERQASESFGLAARDLANGHVRSAQRRQFHIATEPLQPTHIALLIDRAITSKDPAGVLDGLAPQNAQYFALRAALADLPVEAEVERRKIEASLERWRWMPRQMGDRHLLVNIPEYRLRLSVEGREGASHRVIVGKPQTPTPQFSASVSAVILNPPWHVPQSIVAESVGSLVRNRPSVARARGYTWSSAGGRLQVTQQPGPQNALGQMKLDMANGYSVFVHDTSNRELFAQELRTLSHGCIRTDDPFELAGLLLAGSGWTRSRIDDVVATRRTTRIRLEQSIPIYTVYLTAYAAPDGEVHYFDDPYSLDGAVSRLLDDRAGV